jgi:AI-2 transport protein TqsA
MSEAGGHEDEARVREDPSAHAGQEPTEPRPPSAIAALAAQFSPMQRLLITAAAVAVILIFMRMTASVLVPVLLALVITMAVSPFLNWLIRHHFPPIIAWLLTVIVTTAAVVFVFVLGGIGVARLIGELSAYTSTLQTRLSDANGVLGHLGLNGSGLIGKGGVLAPERVINVSIRILDLVRKLLGGVSLTLLIVFFMLAESITLQLKFSRTPPRVSPVLLRLELFTRDMRAFVQATAIIGIINGIAAGVFLYLLGIDFPVMWGLFAFLMTFIPTLGFFIAVIPPVLMGLLSGGWHTALLIFIGYLVIWAITGTLRSGRFVGRRLNLAPVVILLSIILWGWVLGLMGGLLAVPMTLLVRRMLLEAYDESRWITDLLGRPAWTQPEADGPAPAGGATPGE